jgi:hypothetical protein
MSLMSNSIDTSWPRAVSSMCSRCARLLKLWVRKRMRIAEKESNAGLINRCAATARR